MECTSPPWFGAVQYSNRTPYQGRCGENDEEVRACRPRRAARPPSPPQPGRGGQATPSGEDLGVVSRILGHANLATTAGAYAHLTPAMLDRAAGRMEAILGG
jgi:hypothetical protein